MASPSISLLQGDCREQMKTLPDDSIDTIICDPPYNLAFMGKKWDTHINNAAYQEWTREWATEAFRVLKPGGHLLAFGGTRTYHRQTCGIEDAGFEIRDCLAWIYGTGFPKSLDVSKAIDKIDKIGSLHERAMSFTAWMRSTGMSRQIANALCGTASGANHYFEAASQPFVATEEMFGKLRPWFAENGIVVPGHIEEIVASRTVEAANLKRRQVVGTKSAAIAPRGDSSRHTVGGSQSVELDVTAPYSGAAQQWEGWGTALKPAMEPIVVARKPFKGTVAANVLEHGTGALNIDASRIATDERWQGRQLPDADDGATWGGALNRRSSSSHDLGRWPANILFDEEAATALDEESDSRGASRFFYVAKAGKKERNAGLESFPEKEKFQLNASKSAGEIDDVSQRFISQPVANTHPCVKPIQLLRYLSKLVTPPGGTILDPFMGLGSGGCAAVLEGFNYIGIEMEPEYLEIAEARIEHWQSSSE
jgi:DNA modification methylase